MEKFRVEVRKSLFVYGTIDIDADSEIEAEKKINEILQKASGDTIPYESIQGKIDWEDEIVDVGDLISTGKIEEI